MTNSLKRGFDAAKAISVYSNARHSRRMGAALYSGSRLLSLGYNSYNKTHASLKHRHWSIHAEHHALLKRRYYNDPRGLILYVYRELANGTPACSRPCSECLVLMAEAGVRVVRFTEKDGTLGEIKL